MQKLKFVAGLLLLIGIAGGLLAGAGIVVALIFVAFLIFCNFFRALQSLVIGSIGWAVWNYVIAPGLGWFTIAWWPIVGIAFLWLLVAGFLRAPERRSSATTK